MDNNVQYYLHIVESSAATERTQMRFTEGELKVMQLLWEHGEMKPAQLQENFPEPIKNPALRSYLTILVSKGHIARRKVGKAFFYKALTPRRRAFSTMLGELIDTFCQGSMQQLVMTLVREEQLSSQDLEELRKAAGMAADLASSSPDSQPRRASRSPRKKGTRRNVQ